MNETHYREIRLWFRVAGIVFVAAALVAFFSGFYRAKYYRATGDARWIWPETRLSAGAPVAAFAVKEFDVPLSPPFVRIKIACDPEYTLYFNGTVVGRGIAGMSPVLDVYDVTALARQGATNRIVVAVRSANGVGGLIAAVDYAPIRENDVVSDSSWRFVTAWRDDLPERGEAGAGLPARDLGAPPAGRWNELVVQARELAPETVTRVAALESRSISVPVPRIRVAGGVAVSSAELVPASAWDFGDYVGRCLLEIPPMAGPAGPRVLRLRFGNRIEELQREGAPREIAVAPGEAAVLDPQVREARWVAVLDAAAIPSIVPDESAQKKRTPGE